MHKLRGTSLRLCMSTTSFLAKSNNLKSMDFNGRIVHVGNVRVQVDEFLLAFMLWSPIVKLRLVLIYFRDPRDWTLYPN